MIITKKKSEPTLRAGTSTVLRPAVRLVNAMKALVSSFCPKFRPSKVLLHSLNMKNAILTRTIISVKPVAMCVCNDTLRMARFLRSNT